MVFDLSVNGESVSLIGPTAVVASKSQPGEYHTIYNGECTCKGYQYRGRCRHLTAVAELKAAADAVAAKAERAARIAAINAEIWGG